MIHYRGFQSRNSGGRVFKRYRTCAVSAIFIIAFLFFSQVPALHADIYMYRDANGVLHFTNVPTSPNYEIYVKERVKRRDNTHSSTQYDHLITRASRRHGVSFSILKAIIRAESGFNPRAVSKKGAMGLMQIMPENVQILRINDPFDPWDNIRGGAQYFKEMLNRYSGQLPLALAAYNAGPTAVDQYNNIPPYPETRQYVKKVLKFYNAYRKG